MRTCRPEDYKPLPATTRPRAPFFAPAAIFIFFSLVLTGCSWFGGDDIEIADTGEQQIYLDAQRYLDNGSFDLAIRTLQLLESRYPFGRYAEQAQLELVYACLLYTSDAADE